MSKCTFTALLFLLAPVLIFTGLAQNSALGPPGMQKIITDGTQQLEDGRTALDEPILLVARTTFEACLREDQKDARCYYDLARTAYYLKNSAERRKDKTAAEHWLNTAIDDAQHSIALDESSADAHALLGDLYGQKITGMFSGMKYGPKANAETERALQLDPKNAMAYAVVGRKYLYAPAMFGGNIDKAIESFRKATQLNPQDDEAFVWLAIAYRKKGDTKDAKAAVDEALRLNSRSVFAQRVASGAGE